MEVRTLALETLNRIFTRKEYSNLVISSTINGSDMNDKDKALYTQIVYGTLKNKLLLDFYLRPYTDGKKLKNWVRHLLELSVYQMVFLDRIPDYAILSEAVEIAKKIETATAGLVNAVLRNFEVQKEPTEEYIKYSSNEWLFKQIKGQYPETYTEIFESFMEVPKSSARVNLTKISRDRLVGNFFDKSEFVNTGVILKRGNVAETPEYKKGLLTVQDEASQLVARTLNPKKTDYVLDVCAAPGGKTTHIAEIMRNNGKIVANDVHTHRLELIKQNAERLGITNIEYTNNDGLKMDRIYSRETFDRILLDAPCSGWGVIGRKPEIKYFQDQDSVDELMKIQRAMLESVHKLLKIGGILVYSTCTLNRGENDVQVKRFLRDHPNYELDRDNFILPHEHGTDGFYIAKLKKVRR